MLSDLLLTCHLADLMQDLICVCTRPATLLINYYCLPLCLESIFTVFKPRFCTMAGTGQTPCPYRIIDDCGSAFGMGALGGGLFHLIKGMRNSPRGARLRGGFNAVTLRGPTLGGSPFYAAYHDKCAFVDLFSRFLVRRQFRCLGWSFRYVRLHISIYTQAR